MPPRKLMTWRFRANSWLLNWSRLVVHEGWFHGFSRTIMLCSNISTKILEHDILRKTRFFSLDYVFIADITCPFSANWTLSWGRAHLWMFPSHGSVLSGPSLVVSKLQHHPAVIGKERRTRRRRKVALRWTVAELLLVSAELWTLWFCVEGAFVPQQYL